MKEIKLTQNKVALVDDEDYEWLINCGISWHLNGDKHTDYAIGCSGRKKKFKMHTEILKKYGLHENGKEIDHKNHNGLDNRKENLRICTHAQNRRNSKPDKNSTSIYKGVSIFPKKSSKWQSFIFKDGQLIKIGAFYNEKDAAIAYDIFAKKMFGEFAYLNFPDANQNEINKIQIIIDNPKQWGSTSKYIGVCYNKNENKYESYLNHNKQRIYFGKFNIELEAAKIRNDYIINNNLNTRICKLNKI